jgi:hypothetical protein
MSRTMAIARLAMATMCALSCAGAAFAQDDGQDASQAGVQTVRVMTGLQHFFKRVLTEDNAITLNPGPIDAGGFSDYVNLPGAGPGTGAIGVVNGPATLINVRFTAESQCANGGADFGWCGVRILVNGIEAQPAPADYAFDSTNNGGDGTGSWEGHAMDRHLCVRNPSPTGAPFAVPVQVQWRVFAGIDQTTVPEFRLDDWSLTIESAAANACQ